MSVINRKKVHITKEELIKKFPYKKNTITDDLVDLLNSTMEDPNYDPTTFSSALVDYQSVMIDGGYSFKEYVNALRFCALLEVGKSAIDAYRIARSNDEFVQKRMHERPGTVEYDVLSSAATRYRKSKLVRAILTLSDMPLYLMFQGGRYKAVARLMKEMEEAPYAKDRISAADKLLTHVKPPENQKIELEVGVNKQAQEMQDNLFRQIAEISKMQHKRLAAGEALDEVQQIGLTTEIIDVDADKTDS